MDWIGVRKAFHQEPEVSEHEYKTAKKVAEIIQEFDPDKLMTNIGGTGVIAIFDSGQPGDNVLFRCELDALPIQEINDFEHKSISDGVSHKCGHDGHLTGMLAFAEKLKNDPPKKGKAILLFQPAEENGVGAEAMLADPKFAEIQPDWVYAYHNLPGYPLGQIVFRNNSFTAAVKSIIIKLNGKTAHAGEPEHGDNPALAIAQTLEAALSFDNNHPEKDDFAVVTPIHVNLGELAYGISAGYGEVHLTIRCWTSENLQILSDNIEQAAREIAKKHNLSPTIDFTQHFHANQNHDTAVEHIKNVLKNAESKAVERDFPFKFGEDFGLFTQKFNGAMFGIGSGENCPALHNPDYDFPDELIEIGASFFHNIFKAINA